MKRIEQNENPRLSKLLSEWKVDEPLPPRFVERVWRRIESVETRRAASSHGTDWLAVLFARPAFATAIATVLLAAGLAAGLWRAGQDTAHWESELAHRYAASVNPYAAEGP